MSKLWLCIAVPLVFLCLLLSVDPNLQRHATSDSVVQEDDDSLPNLDAPVLGVVPPPLENDSKVVPPRPMPSPLVQYIDSRVVPLDRGVADHNEVHIHPQVLAPPEPPRSVRQGDLKHLITLEPWIEKNVSLHPDLYEFHGCYDVPRKRDTIFPNLPGSTQDSGPFQPMTLEMCWAFCSNYELFGVRNLQCVCGSHDAVRGTRTNRESCDHPCPGESSQHCGGRIQWGVFANRQRSLAPAQPPMPMVNYGCVAPSAVSEQEPVFVFTALTSLSSLACLELASAAFNGINFHVFATKDPTAFSKYGHLPILLQRVKCAISILAGLPPDTIVLFVDGSDVFFNTGIEEILAKYHKLDKPIVLGTQATCTGPPSAPICKQFPMSKRLRYVNGGGYMGRAGLMREFLEDVSARNERHPDADDQMHFQYVCKEPRWVPLLAFDYGHTIFHNTHVLNLQEEFCFPDPDSRRVHNCVMNVAPSTIHMQGWKKAEAHLVYRLMWWRAATWKTSPTFWISGRHVPWESACPNLQLLFSDSQPHRILSSRTGIIPDSTAKK